jgi:hypothetical protein
MDGADALALRLEDRHIHIEVAARNAEGFDERVDDAGRFGVALVDAAKGDGREGAFAVVGVGVALNGLPDQGGEPLALFREHGDDAGPLGLAVIGRELGGFYKCQ